MALKETTYVLSLTGGKITVKDKTISEETALSVISVIMGGGGHVSGVQSPKGVTPNFNQAERGVGTLSAKTFMTEKKPMSGLERITCLAYYLSTFRDTHAFKTRDLTKLNTEAAQPAFSNAAVFGRNAEVAGYFAKAGGGSKQITSLGEAVVKALPDRANVKKAIEEHAIARKRRAKKSQGTKKKH